MSGWRHLPTTTEITALYDYLGGFTVAGGKMKESGTAHWITPNTGATNESGFTALPGGLRAVSAAYIMVGTYGSWWSSTVNSPGALYVMNLDNTSSNISMSNSQSTWGYSVRCLKD